MAKRKTPQKPATLGQRIRALRKARGLRVREVADTIGVGEQQVYRWEVDKDHPSRSNEIGRAHV